MLEAFVELQARICLLGDAGSHNAAAGLSLRLEGKSECMMREEMKVVRRPAAPGALPKASEFRQLLESLPE
ncbi:hypothetical protein [Bradyrhizobium sp. ARR65]|uniref:hypothetical protein n=1 Tax=Bradyrhizobium sp. ARR65 TaxID=1040989 RepID=UPI0012F76B8A|nr:hypothetical protein [Bradyrhizobium sp. ARR65]